MQGQSIGASTVSGSQKIKLPSPLDISYRGSRESPHVPMYRGLTVNSAAQY